MYRGVELPGQGQLFDYRGGLASAKPVTKLDLNQGTDLRNLFITPGGGIEKRRGNTTFNSSEMGSSSTAITGLAYYKQEDGTEFLHAVAGAVIYRSDSLDGTMDVVTGSATVTADQDNHYDMFTFNNKLIGVGGAPDAPWVLTGTGTAANLGGSPPSGSFGFQHNNRVFIGGSAANPSRINWSVLADEADWSGAGSGNQDIWTSDNDSLVGAAIINDYHVLLFKENSVHLLTGRTSPFPVTPLFKGIGAVGKHAIVEADGLVYFISSNPSRMLVTDGTRIIGEETFPRLNDIDDVWNGLNASRAKYIQGIRHRGIDFDHIKWICTNGTDTTNSLSLIWDLRNKCWLKDDSGHQGNTLARTQDGTFYMGAYDGTIYKMDVEDTYSDASGGSTATAIDMFWQWGWFTSQGLQHTIKPNQIHFIFESQTAGSLDVKYGFNFTSGSKSGNFSMQAAGGLWDQMIWDSGVWGGQSDLKKALRLAGRGNVFQIAFQQNVLDQKAKIHGFSLSGKPSGQKKFTAV